MEKKYSAEEVVSIIKKDMEVEERYKLLDKLYEMYYDTRSDKKRAHQS